MLSEGLCDADRWGKESQRPNGAPPSVWVSASCRICGAGVARVTALGWWHTKGNRSKSCGDLGGRLEYERDLMRKSHPTLFGTLAQPGSCKTELMSGKPLATSE